MGFPVMGVWPDYSDGTDINCLSVSSHKDVIVTADDFGGVKMFNFPCLVEDSPFKRYKGHASHVSGVAFIGDDYGVVSTGSLDRAVIYWGFEGGEKDRAKKASAKLENGGVGPNNSIMFLPDQQALIDNVAKQHEEEEELVDKFYDRSQNPLGALLDKNYKGDGGGGRGEVGPRNMNMIRDVKLLEDFLSKMLSGEEEKASDDVVGINSQGPRKEEEEGETAVEDENFGVQFVASEGMDISDAELKLVPFLWEAENAARKERLKVRIDERVAEGKKKNAKKYNTEKS